MDQMVNGDPARSRLRGCIANGTRLGTRSPASRKEFVMKYDCRIVVMAAVSLLAAACGGSNGDTSSGGSGGSGGSSGPGGSEAGQDPPTTLTIAPAGTPIDKAAKNTYWFCPRPGLIPKLAGSDAPWISGTT